MIQGARIAGAGKIIAIDMFDSKLEDGQGVRRHRHGQPEQRRRRRPGRRLTGGRGADVAFEVIGLEATMQQTIDMIRPGGEAILVGVPRMDVMLELNAAFTFLYLDKTVKGCWYGSSDVHKDVPKLLDLWKNGRAQAGGADLPGDQGRAGERGVRCDGFGRGRPLRDQHCGARVGARPTGGSTVRYRRRRRPTVSGRRPVGGGRSGSGGRREVAGGCVRSFTLVRWARFVLPSTIDGPRHGPTDRTPPLGRLRRDGVVNCSTSPSRCSPSMASTARR